MVNTVLHSPKNDDGDVRDRGERAAAYRFADYISSALLVEKSRRRDNKLAITTGVGDPMRFLLGTGAPIERSNGSINLFRGECEERKTERESGLTN